MSAQTKTLRIDDFTVSSAWHSLISVSGHLESIVRISKMIKALCNDLSLPLLPMYNDHSISHIGGVLNAAWDLIPKKCVKLLTPSDAIVLYVSILLHDAAMHFDKQMLDAYILLDEARDLNIGKDDSPDVIVRNNHHLLAKMIAQHGLYDCASHQIKPLVDNPSGTLSELIAKAGVVAKSHGLPIRELADELSPEPLRWGFDNEVHLPYLCAVLRIADFLQINVERSLPDRFSLRMPESEFSQIEWQKDAAILKLVRNEHIPTRLESILDKSAIKNVKVFSRIQQYFAELQNELDLTNAFVEEIYPASRNTRLELSVKSIDSRLSSIKESLPFFPERVVIEAGGQRLIWLLLENLYGRDESIGTRELLQNALDAVDAQAALSVKECDNKFVEEVTVFWDQVSTPPLLIVSDNGVGMSISVVRDYYTKVGMHFENPFSGFSRGFFGIGALASFLLGDTVHVTTREHGAKEGIKFTIEKNSTELINCVRDSTAPFGTTVKVELHKTEDGENDDAILGLHWLADRSRNVSFQVRTEDGLESKKIDLEVQPAFCPSEDDVPTGGWRRVQSVETTAIFIFPCFDDAESELMSGIAYNGLWLGGASASVQLSSGPWISKSLFCQWLSIYDRGRKLDLNLSRDNFVKFPFELLVEIHVELLNYLAESLRQLVKSLESDGVGFSKIFLDIKEYLFVGSSGIYLAWRLDCLPESIKFVRVGEFDSADWEMASDEIMPLDIRFFERIQEYVSIDNMINPIIEPGAQESQFIIAGRINSAIIGTKLDISNKSYNWEDKIQRNEPQDYELLTDESKSRFFAPWSNSFTKAKLFRSLIANSVNPH